MNKLDSQAGSITSTGFLCRRCSQKLLYSRRKLRSEKTSSVPQLKVRKYASTRMLAVSLKGSACMRDAIIASGAWSRRNRVACREAGGKATGKKIVDCVLVSGAIFCLRKSGILIRQCHLQLSGNTCTHLHINVSIATGRHFWRMNAERSARS